MQSQGKSGTCERYAVKALNKQMITVGAQIAMGMLALLLWSATCQGQTSGFTFPYGHEADKWVYEVTDNNDPWHVTSATLRWGRDTVMRNGKAYRGFGNGTHDLFYFRQDGDRVLEFAPWDTSEFPRYDFSKTMGDTIAEFVNQNHDTSIIYLTADYQLPLFGASRRALEIHGIRYQVWDTVVDSLGIVVFPVTTETVYGLKGALIGGRVYGDLTSLGDNRELFPSAPALAQNYPNPFNPSTTIRYAVPHRSQVTLTVFNTLGQQVATLVNCELEPGYHEATFDGSGFSSGVYFYRLAAGDFVATKKLTLLH